MFSSGHRGVTPGIQSKLSPPSSASLSPSFLPSRCCPPASPIHERCLYASFLFRISTLTVSLLYASAVMHLFGADCLAMLASRIIFQDKMNHARAEEFRSLRNSRDAKESVSERNFATFSVLQERSAMSGRFAPVFHFAPGL